MQKILDFIFSKPFKVGICFVFFTVIMTGTISSQNFFFQRVIENGISKRTIVAQKDIKVIDTEKTEFKRKQVAQSVEPVLTRSEDVSALSNLDSLYKSVEAIRANNEPYNTKTEKLSVLFDENVSRAVIEFLLRTGESELNTLFDRAKITLNGVLNTGVSSKDFETNNVDTIIRNNIPLTTPRGQVPYISAIVGQIISPNLVVNEYATEIVKTNAQAAVKPYEVVFKKGQQIVFEGDKVTKLKKDALRAAGYNVLEVNFGGILGIYALVAFFTFIFLQYERNFEKPYYNARYLNITASLSFFITLIATMLPTGFSPYILPLPAYTILLSIFTTPRNAFFASTILLAMLSVGMHYNMEVIVAYMLLNTVVMTAMSRLKFSKRSDLLIISLKISLAGALIVGGIYFLEKYMMDINNLMILNDMGIILVNCFLISGVILLGLLPIIENVFGVMTPYGLAELSDSKLLRKLLSDAPGTYNHSLIVSQLVEAAAEAIGANSVLARVGTMYHDVGKLLRPMFFVENQSFYGIENPHKTCTPRFSKMLITAHPKDGVELAKDKEYHIPQIIYPFILQHHGTSVVSYFYNEALKDEGEDNVKEEQFRYPGPKPNMKETAILMLADAVESAVRAAKNPSNEEIDEIIQKIVKERLNDGQLDESPLTLKDLKTISETFSRMLRGMHHKRIKYHNDLVQELDKNRHGDEDDDDVTPKPAPAVLDSDLELKILELESKKNDGN